MFGFRRVERMGLEFYGYEPTAKMKKWLEGKGYRQSDDEVTLGIDYHGNPLELAEEEELSALARWLTLYCETAEDISQFITEGTLDPVDLQRKGCSSSVESLRIETMIEESSPACFMLSSITFGRYYDDEVEEQKHAFPDRYLWAVYDWLRENGYESATGPERAAELIEGYVAHLEDLAA